MSDLGAFVHDALAAGKGRDEISRALLQAGWRTDEVNRALGAFADVDFAVPVPRRAPHLSARDAFQHLVAFCTLYISAIGVGMLLFMFVNLILPDRLSASEWRHREVYQLLRSGAASVIIAFPVYLLVTARLNREYAQDLDRRSSPVRKWLTYLTLFVASAIVIGYLIALVDKLLGGELAASFAVKVLIVLTLSGAVFAYYMPGLQQDEKQGFDDLQSAA